MSALNGGPSDGAHAVLARHCRHPRSVGREYPPAATHRASPPARTQCGRRAHTPHAMGVLASTQCSLPCGECAFCCGARASPLRTPRPRTRVRAGAHTRTHSHAPARMRAWMYAQASAPVGDVPPSTDRARPMRTAPCVLYVWSVGYRDRQWTRHGIVGRGCCRSSLPCPGEGECARNVDHRSFGGPACVRRGRDGRMQRWETSAA
jgi:hypothetical protein